MSAIINGDSPSITFSDGTTQSTAALTTGGTIANGTITALTATTATLPTATITTLKAPSGVLATQNGMTGIAKAWVNFQGGNGNTAGTINGSFNVSSITVNGTGNYTINFTTAMPNTSYCATVSMTPSTGAAGGSANRVSQPIAFTTTTLQIICGVASLSALENSINSFVAVFSS